MSRSHAQKLVEEEGGEASSGVSSTTDLVVAGEDAGSKLEEAKKKGIKIISEEEFFKILSQDLH
jgi:DNA ligase (NAD+)